jgi:hypothetical protein
VPARAADERLMRLDAALVGPDLEWLTTRSEKLAFLESRTAGESRKAKADAPVAGPANIANEFRGTFPIGIDGTGRTMLLYLATKPWTDDFRTFLVGHTSLLGVTPTWTLRLVFPQSIRRAVAAYQTVVHEELESRLDADTIRELQHYFFHRRRGTDLTAIPENLTDPDYTRKCSFAADAAIDGGGGRPSRVRSATRLRAERSLDSGAHYRPAVCRFEIS